MSAETLAHRAEPQHPLMKEGSHGEDVIYRNGALWIATPSDDTVYKVLVSSAAVIPSN